MKENAENAQMMKMYREHVLGEKPVEGIVPLSAIAPAAPKPAGSRKKSAPSATSFTGSLDSKAARNAGSLFHFHGNGCDRSQRRRDSFIIF